MYNETTKTEKIGGDAVRNKQIIYDDDAFFQGYQELRENPYNYNLLIEHPALTALLPNLNGKSVLDMGCGFGEMCIEFYERGAEFITGVDMSEKMLQQARKHQNNKTEFLCMDMCDIKNLNRKYDLITSSLAVHYVADWAELVQNVFACLNDNGIFLFSQEHPLTTAPMDGAEYEHDTDGSGIHYRLTDYGRSGERRIEWFVDGVVKYHRTFSEILNTLISAGFRIDELKEPLPTAQAIEKNPKMIKEFHKPSFLLVKAVKALSEK